LQSRPALTEAESADRPEGASVRRRASWVQILLSITSVVLQGLW